MNKSETQVEMVNPEDKFTPDQVKIIRNMIAPSLTEDEFKMFLEIALKTRLNPITKQIYAMKMNGRLIVMASIDGLRVIADRTSCYAPGKASTYEHDDKGNLIAATAYVQKLTRDGTWHEVSATAYNCEYNKKQNLWNTMPRVMLAKCAESLALRKAFPAETCNLYTEEEMDQAKETDPLKREPLLESQLAYLSQLHDANADAGKAILEAYKISSYSELPPISNAAYQKIVEKLKGGRS